MNKVVGVLVVLVVCLMLAEASPLSRKYKSPYYRTIESLLEKKLQTLTQTWYGPGAPALHEQSMITRSTNRRATLTRSNSDCFNTKNCSGTYIQLTSSQITEILGVHNGLRQNLTDPRPQNVLPTFTWNQNLADIWTLNPNSCSFEHISSADASRWYSQLSGAPNNTAIGENLAQTYSFIVNSGEFTTNYDYNFFNLYSGWGNEKACYTYSPVGSDICNETCFKALNSDGCGHYTQQIWEQSTQLGCIIVNCTDYPVNSSQNGFQLVCDYLPAGNYLGQFPYAAAAAPVTVSASPSPFSNSPSTTSSASTSTPPSSRPPSISNTPSSTSTASASASTSTSVSASASTSTSVSASASTSLSATSSTSFSSTSTRSVTNSPSTSAPPSLSSSASVTSVPSVSTGASPSSTSSVSFSASTTPSTSVSRSTSVSNSASTTPSATGSVSVSTSASVTSTPSTSVAPSTSASSSIAPTPSSSGSTGASASSTSSVSISPSSPASSSTGATASASSSPGLSAGSGGGNAGSNLPPTPSASITPSPGTDPSRSPSASLSAGVTPSSSPAVCLLTRRVGRQGTLSRN
eukprot:TRINITY_DN7053_c0_g1_i5.p1 TRINITY_DN7053_c0_g1~~TRINITY_DN7053_c0_g1_i5.p1  ORF type:complete len:578 (+),score=147.80 TRINITY_DN7053_c0_g1_i5:73-1806(+)